MNIDELKTLSEPNAANLLAIHEHNKQNLGRFKLFFREIKGFVPQKEFNAWVKAVKDQESELNKFEKYLGLGDDFYENLSPEYKKVFAHLHECSITQEENFQSTVVALRRSKQELLDLHKPPILSEIVTRLVVSHRQADRVIDSRAEAFVINIVKHGLVRAYVYHWVDTVKTCWPMLKRLIPFAALLEGLRRWFGS